MWCRVIFSSARSSYATPVGEVLTAALAWLGVSAKSSNTSLGMAGATSVLSREEKIKLAPESRATRSAKSIVAPSSMGTATAPRKRHPQNAAAHSALFGPQSRTRSPVRIPRSFSSAAQTTATLASLPKVQFSRRYPRLCTNAKSSRYRSNSRKRDKRLSRDMIPGSHTLLRWLDSTPANCVSAAVPGIDVHVHCHLALVLLHSLGVWYPSSLRGRSYSTPPRGNVWR